MAQSPPETTTHEGLSYKGSGFEFGASDQSVTQLTQSAERMWSETLAWSSENPILCVIVGFFLLCAYAVKRWSNVEIQAMKDAYQDRRLSRPTQIPLPLPKNED